MTSPTASNGNVLHVAFCTEPEVPAELAALVARTETIDVDGLIEDGVSLHTIAEQNGSDSVTEADRDTGAALLALSALLKEV